VKRALPAALVTAAVLAGAGPAGAYVRSTSRDGHPLHWGKRDPRAILYPASVPADLPGETFLKAARAAAATWGSAALSCTDISIGFDESGDATAETAAEGISRVVYRAHDDWPYATDVLALTSVFSRGGVIFDADIELNGVSQIWTDVVADGRRARHDVQNVLTHELGHFLGFDHTCYDPRVRRDGPLPNDNTGQPIPSCDLASPEIFATTMFPSAMSGDTSKRDLSPDDQKAVCDVYSNDYGGCALGGRGGAGGAWLLLVIVPLLRRRRR
jgi:hypothetical protein